MTSAKELQKALTFEFPHIGKVAADQKEAAFAYCEGYKNFLNIAKIEREFVAEAIKLLEVAGYKPFHPLIKNNPGDKVYFNNRGKALLISTIGTAPLEKGVRLNVAHIDSPRLDLKPNPVYENKDIAYFKTHYYGGIRKYQWVTIPLAMHGVIIKQDGEIVKVCLGEAEDEPKFCVTDLLPHLGAKQNERKLNEGIAGEELNIVIGSLPFVDEEGEEIKEAVKLNALAILNEYYGITEKDFMRAEIEFVPAQKAIDIGFDRSLIGAYGQDDKVCAYTALTAEIDTKAPYYTTVTVLADKEEIGSYGNTGLDSDFVLHYLQDLAEVQGCNSFNSLLRNTTCLSSDVNGAYDPTFSFVYEERNSCFINKGCVLTKYTGARGKSGSNDASAETMAKVISIMDEAKVYWQIGELGKVDEGGGGTVALYVASMDIDVVDLGVPILCMHAPMELASKFDVYHTYKAFAAFLASDK